MNADDDRSIPVAKSYIYRGDRAWFVSTIDRVSSAALAYGHRYFETIVWETNPETHERLSRILYQAGAPHGSLREHGAVCERLYATGNPEEPDHAD